MQVRKNGSTNIKYASVENASSENRSTNLRRMKMQVWKTRTNLRGWKTQVKRVYYAFPVTCLTSNFLNSYWYDISK